VTYGHPFCPEGAQAKSGAAIQSIDENRASREVHMTPSTTEAALQTF
jgi:hypothetical protein